MWLPSSVIADVDRLARVHYVDQALCAVWNARREADELRLLTGWCWTTKDGRAFRQGFKTATVCYRDAWYELVQKTEAPRLRTRLRAVA